ncbi:MAG: aldo/keto reductase [Candidatus Poribacteria bacterium]|nr:aldo/keto reductase [Candidatus Poribacteria bacterium]
MPDFNADRYKQMKYRHCGRSGLQLPEVSLGFWQSLGERGNDDLCREMMYLAFDNGITHFDFANNYGPPAGNSELVAGKILKDMPRDELIISSKAGYGMWSGPYGDGGSKKYLVASLDQSLKRLGLDYVDIFYHHRPDSDTPLEETMGALDLIVRQGKALYTGVSNYGGTVFRDAVDTLRRHDWTPLTIHQPSYNMLNRRVGTDLLPHTDAAGVGVISFCPLAQGMLTDRYLNGLPSDSRQGRRGDSGQRWYQEQKERGVWDKVGRLNEIAQERGQKMAQLALSWLLRDRRITSVLIGASKKEQLLENIAAVHAAEITDEEQRRIDSILSS